MARVNWLERARRELQAQEIGLRWWVDHAGNAWINTRLTMGNPLSPEEIEQMQREHDEIVRLAAGVN